jgi:hypothetical protein
MTVFTYVIYLSIIKAYAINQKVALECNDPTMSNFMFKRNICNYLISPWKANHGQRDNSGGAVTLPQLDESMKAVH